MDRRRLSQGNPSQLVQRRVGDDFKSAGGQLETSRAFTLPVWAALLAQIERETKVAGAARMRWLLPFAQATGLRPAELLQARREDFVRRKGTWWLKVHGKGARNRVVPVASKAMAATQRYLAAAGPGLRYGAARDGAAGSAGVPRAPGRDRVVVLQPACLAQGLRAARTAAQPLDG